MQMALASAMHALHDRIYLPVAVLVVTDPWEAARRLYLMVQYFKLLHSIWKLRRKTK